MWHTPDTARDVWRDANQLDDTDLVELLDVAQLQILAYATPADVTEASGGNVGVNLRMAQLMQAKNIYNAARVDPSNGIGDGDSFTLTPMPLDWHVKQLIRPRTAHINVR